MKTFIIWDAASCSLVNSGRCFGTACCLHHQGDHPDDVRSKLLSNIGRLLEDYVVQHPQEEIIETDKVQL
jgi:hypothetical protein